MTTIRVLAAVVLRDGAWLLARRPPHKRHGGAWEFPGGKVEAGEDDFTAIARELGEELGVTVTACGAPWYAHRDPGTAFEVVFLPVTCDGDPVPHEHDALAWWRPEDTPRHGLAPSDAAFVAWWRAHGVVTPAAASPASPASPVSPAAEAPPESPTSSRADAATP